MAASKLISIRLDSVHVIKIDRIAYQKSYWNRSSVIQGILRAVLENASTATIQRMIEFWPSATKSYTITFDENPKPGKL